MTEGIRLKMKPESILPENLNGIYRELAELVGVEAALKIHNTHRGQTISLPVEFFSKEYIFAEIIGERRSGKTVKQLATEFGYSEKWIRKILKEKEEAQGEQA